MLGNARKSVDGMQVEEWKFWCLGCALFANVVAFFGVNYFDQSRVGWFVLLAMVSTVAAPNLTSNPVREAEPQQAGFALRRRLSVASRARLPIPHVPSVGDKRQR
jgi:hypothetical protein